LTGVATLAETSLSADERALLERFAEVATARLGGGLHSIWLFGSRARGEHPAHEDSDIDLLVLVDDASWEGKRRVYAAFDEAAEELGLESLSTWFSTHIQTPAWLEGRRAIKSFFIAEVDRDKIVVTGSP
jgi:predicted nucleotidyltransferase